MSSQLWSIVLGLGTSGMHTLNVVQQILYGAFRNKIVSPNASGGSTPASGNTSWSMATLEGVSLICIETDGAVVPGQTPKGTLIEKIPAVVPNIGNATKALRRIEPQHTSWIPENLEDRLRSKGILEGAGNYRAAGRLALWEPNNFARVYSTLERRFRSLPHDQGKPNIVVTGTLLGGTCSGMFIDIGYILREVTDNKANIVGVFFVPEGPLGTAHHRRCANSWAAMEDLEYFSHADFHCVWPNGVRCRHGNMPPYDISYLISTGYERGAPFRSLTDHEYLYHLCGWFISCYISGLQETVASVAVDADAGTTFRSFGFSGLSCPIHSLEEMVALDLSNQLIDHLVGEKEYLSPVSGEKVSINRSSLEKDAEEFLDDTVCRVAEVFQRLGDESLVDRIKGLARDWERGVVTGDMLRSEFKWIPAKPNICALMEGQKNQVQQDLIRRINSRIKEVLEETESLEAAEHFLDGLASHVSRLLHFWESQGTKENLEGLNSALECDPIEKRGAWAIDREKRNEQTVKRLADRVIVFCLSQILRSLDFHSNAETRESLALTRKKIEEIRTGLTDAQVGARARTRERRMKLKRVLEERNLPVKMLWVHGGAENDAHAVSRSMRATYKSLSREVGLIEFLGRFQLSPNSDNPQDGHAWSDLVCSFQRKVNEELSRRAASYDVARILKERHVRIEDVAEQAASVLLPIEVGGLRYGRHPGVPSVMIHSSETMLQRLSLSIPNGFDTFCQIAPFTHDVFFYQEILSLSPSKDLAYREEFRKIRYKTPRSANGERSFSAKEWEMLLDPYQVERGRLQFLAGHLAETVCKKAIRWRKEPLTGELKASGSNCPGIDIAEEDTSVRFSVNGEQFLNVSHGRPQEVQECLFKGLLKNEPFRSSLSEVLDGWASENSLAEESCDYLDQMSWGARQIADSTKTDKGLPSA